MKNITYFLTVLAFGFIWNAKGQNTPKPVDRNCEQYRERDEAWANSNDLEVCNRKSTPYTECVCQTARDWVEYRKERESIKNLYVQFRTMAERKGKEFNEITGVAYKYEASLMKENGYSPNFENYQRKTIDAYYRAIENRRYIIRNINRSCRDKVFENDCNMKISGCKRDIASLENRLQKVKNMKPFDKGNNDNVSGHRGGNGKSTDNSNNQLSKQETQQKRIEAQQRKEQERVEQEIAKIEEQNKKIDQASDEISHELGKIFTGEFEPQSMMNITQSVLNTGLINSVEGAMGVGLAGGIGAAAVGIIQQAKEDKIKRNINSLKNNLEKYEKEYTVFSNAVENNDNESLILSHTRLWGIEFNILENTDYLIKNANQSDLRKLENGIEESQEKRNTGVRKAVANNFSRYSRLLQNKKI